MRDKTKKGVFAVFLAAVTMAFAGIGISGTAARADDNDYAVKNDEYYHYVQKFENADSVNNAFHAYYLENALGSAKAETVVTDVNAVDSHWATDGGVLKRINDVKKDANTGKYETNQVAVLTFTKEAYLNFELSVDFKRGSAGYWPVIAIRQVEEGKYYLDDGAGIFVQQSGTITLWGDQVMSGPYEFGTVDGYSDGAWHNIQIKVTGNELKVSVDNQPWATQALKEEFYESGYVSLCSVNNQSEYRNFRIKALPEPEKPASKDFDPVKEADTDDALSRLAGEVKDKSELFEREPKSTGSKPAEESSGNTTESKGCKGSAACGAIFALPLAAALFVSKKRK